MMTALVVFLLFALCAGIYLTGLACARLGFHDELEAAEASGYELGMQRGYEMGCEDTLQAVKAMKGAIDALPASAHNQRRGVVLELN